MYAHERSLAKRFQTKPFVLLGVNSDKNRDEIKKICTLEKIPMRSWWNGGSPKGPISAAWGIAAWPTLFVIDADGIVRFKLNGPKGLDEAVAKLLRELERKEAKLHAAESVKGKASTARNSVQHEIDPNERERQARVKFDLAKSLADDGKVQRAKERLVEIIDKFAGTDGAAKAKELLEKLQD